MFVYTCETGEVIEALQHNLWILSSNFHHNVEMVEVGPCRCRRHTHFDTGKAQTSNLCCVRGYYLIVSSSHCYDLISSVSSIHQRDAGLVLPTRSSFCD